MWVRAGQLILCRITATKIDDYDWVCFHDAGSLKAFLVIENIYLFDHNTLRIVTDKGVVGARKTHIKAMIG